MEARKTGSSSRVGADEVSSLGLEACDEVPSLGSGACDKVPSRGLGACDEVPSRGSGACDEVPSLGLEAYVGRDSVRNDGISPGSGDIRRDWTGDVRGDKAKLRCRRGSRGDTLDLVRGGVAKDRSVGEALLSGCPNCCGTR